MREGDDNRTAKDKIVSDYIVSVYMLQCKVSYLWGVKRICFWDFDFELKPATCVREKTG